MKNAALQYYVTLRYTVYRYSINVQYVAQGCCYSALCRTEIKLFCITSHKNIAIQHYVMQGDIALKHYVI